MIASEVGPHRPRLLQLLAAAAGDPGHLRGESLDVLGLALQHRFRDEEREVGVLDAGRLDPGVEPVHHPLPQPIAVGPDHLAAAHRAIVGQLRLAHDLDVPAVEIVFLIDQFFDVASFGHLVLQCLRHADGNAETIAGSDDRAVQ